MIFLQFLYTEHKNTNTFASETQFPVARLKN